MDEPTIHHRRSIRLQSYDYSLQGAYFVTISTYRRILLFGEVAEDIVRLNELGEIARSCWQDIPTHFADVDIDAFAVMPNHVHGILVLAASEERARHAVPLRDRLPPREFSKPTSGSLATVTGSFKSAVTRRINALHRNGPVWQRNYYEHVIRDESDLNLVRGYIATNPLRWALDSENPDNTLPATQESPLFTWER